MTKLKVKRGKPVNLYLRDADLNKVRELTAFVAGQGDRTSDSLIVRAAIHAASPGRGFMDVYREVAAADLRFKRE
ncbi:MAG TPA: hypothetical protein VGG45_10740 [Terracidiphilus sp.]|jgi:hypothetical protein